MDFYLSILTPGLSRCLEISFLTGYVTCSKIEQSNKGRKGGLFPLPRLPKAPSKNSTSIKPLTNGTVDATGDGNIWHRYETLEKAQKTLEAQMEEERASHKKEVVRLEAQLAQAKSEENEKPPNVLPTKQSDGRTTTELTTQLCETQSQLEKLEQEVSAGQTHIEFMESERSALRAENNFLKKLSPRHLPRPTPFSGGKPQARNGMVSGPMRSPNQSPIQSPAISPIQSPNQSPPDSPKRSGGLDWQLASFGSHIDVRASNSHSGDLTFDLNPSLDLGPREPPKAESFTEQAVEDLVNRALSHDTERLSRLEEMNNELLEANQHLTTQNEILIGATSTIDADLQDKYNKVMQENTRLQSKILKLDLGAWPQEYSEAMRTLASVQSENDKLCDDNDQLMKHSEALEKQNKDLAMRLTSNSGSTRAWPSSNEERLMADNAALVDQVTRLKNVMEETDPPETTVSTEHDSDKELMALVEELRDENRSIFEELEQLKSKATFESLRMSLHSINSADSSATNTLGALSSSEELGLASKWSSSPAEVLGAAQSIFGSRDSFMTEKAKTDAQLTELKKIILELEAENEELIKQKATQYSEHASSMKQEGPNKPENRGLLRRISRSLRKRSSKEGNVKNSREGESEDEDEETPDASVRSVDSLTDLIKKGYNPSRQLLQNLLEENEKLTKECKRLEASASTIGELTEVNEMLLAQNSRLSKRVEEILGKNRELTSTLAKLLHEEMGGSNASMSEVESPRIPMNGSKDKTEQKQPESEAMISPKTPDRSYDENEKEHGDENEDENEKEELYTQTNEKESERKSKTALPRTGSYEELTFRPLLSPWGEELKMNSQSDNDNTENTDDTPPPPPLNGRIGEGSGELASDFDLGLHIALSQQRWEGRKSVSPLYAKPAQEKVERAFEMYFEKHDLGSFMIELGYPGFEPLPQNPTDEMIRAVRQKGMKLTSEIQLADEASPEEKALAHYTYTGLEEWFMADLGGAHKELYRGFNKSL